MTTRSSKTAVWPDTFRNILELERANGFNDRSVTSGGMDSFVRHWAEAMTSLAPKSPGARQLIRPGYSGMSPAERAEWVARWLVLLDGGTPATTTDGLSSSESTNSSREGNESVVTAQDKGTQDKRVRTRTRSKATDQSTEVNLESSIESLKGIRAKTVGLLKRLDVFTIRDLLYFFPWRYTDYSDAVKIVELQYGQEMTITARVREIQSLKSFRGGTPRVEAIVEDDSGEIRVTWFGQPYLVQTLRQGTEVVISGQVSSYRGRLTLTSPDYEVVRSDRESIQAGRLLPVYHLTEGLTARAVRTLTWQTLETWLPQVVELLPETARKRTNLVTLKEAIQQAHYPDSVESRDKARRRLAFDELLTLQLSVLARRQREVGLLEGPAIEAPAQFVDNLLSSLPFELTGAQRRCLDEILEDMRRGTPPMNRLLQGEVGSGKTVVVLIAILVAIAGGYQGAIMVPTEVLAEQHFQTVTRLLGGMADITQAENLLTVYLETLGRPMTVGLLTGSTRARPRNRLRALAAEGSLDLLIGTHALIQDGVEMPRLALAVMDEQHRFGVLQRLALRQRSAENPHTLVMSATPIPRTLTLTLYGDLDISAVDELPPGRQEIQTRYIDPERREAAYGFIRRQVEGGRQAFIVCPLIEESEVIEAKAASDEHERLSREVFPDLKLGLLHGRMSAAEKDKVMRSYRDGELDILVTTAVVEVGIDVPNATVMLIEGADRFGLSQLHQFRGRVGRGEHKSYCILMSDNPSQSAQERLSALERTRDGFQLAEIDLELRGPGDFFGTRQSGMPALRMARLSDRDLLDLARQQATRIMDEDPDLAKAEHAALAGQVARFTERVSGEMS